MEKICIIYVTAADRAEAERIGRKLVSMRLAACVNVYDNMTSIYRWDGEERRDTEAGLVIKTREFLFPRVRAEVRAMHSYDNPCILAVPVETADGQYAEWIMNETAQQEGDE
jgi:periplasmic divalent cation tolerance protein